jgi:hypothetical protein
MHTDTHDEVIASPNDVNALKKTQTWRLTAAEHSCYNEESKLYESISVSKHNSLSLE